MSQVRPRVRSSALGYSAAIIAAALVLGSASPVLAADHASKSNVVLADARSNGTAEVASASSFRNDDAVRLSTQRPWPAPVGHHQPRVSDISNSVQLSPVEREERRLDRELDAKLVICRGC
jgi:hypothetical protein